MCTPKIRVLVDWIGWGMGWWWKGTAKYFAVCTSSQSYFIIFSILSVRLFYIGIFIVSYIHSKKQLCYINSLLQSSYFLPSSALMVQFYLYYYEKKACMVVDGDGYHSIMDCIGKQQFSMLDGIPSHNHHHRHHITIKRISITFK